MYICTVASQQPLVDSTSTLSSEPLHSTVAYRSNISIDTWTLNYITSTPIRYGIGRSCRCPSFGYTLFTCCRYIPLGRFPHLYPFPVTTYTTLEPHTVLALAISPSSRCRSQLLLAWCERSCCPASRVLWRTKSATYGYMELGVRSASDQWSLKQFGMCRTLPTPP